MFLTKPVSGRIPAEEDAQLKPWVEVEVFGSTSLQAGGLLIPSLEAAKFQITMYIIKLHPKKHNKTNKKKILVDKKSEKLLALLGGEIQ